MISFVIVTYNSGNTLKKCLESLIKQKDSEVIVVDNASSDNSAKIAKSYKSVKLINAGDNLGFNGGNQLGFEKSKGEIVVFLNPDASVPKDFSSKIADAFKNEDAEVIGCRILNVDGSLQRTCNTFPNLRSMLYEHSGYHLIFPNSKSYKKFIYSDWDRKSARYVDAVSGACTAIKRITLDRIGGLDTRYFLFYEEMDLSKRVKNIGGKIKFLPEPAITHIGSTSTKKVAQGHIDKIYFNSRDRYVKKFYGEWYLLVFKAACKLFNVIAKILIKIRFVTPQSAEEK